METSETCDSAQDLLNVEYYLEFVMECAAGKRESRTRWIEVPHGSAARPLDLEVEDQASLGRID